MGNKNDKERDVNCSSSVNGVYIQKDDLNQNQFGNRKLSGRSFASVSSHQSTYSLARPWSRVSRRRWKDSTLNQPYESSKTVWPVSQQESLFLPEFPSNSVINSKDFEIIQDISEGAFGRVYLAKKQTDNQLYALKVLSKSKVIRENCLRQVKEEVQIQSACGHHPFIVECPHHWQSTKRLYIVTDFIAGGELYALLQLYRILPQVLVRLYVAELALALDFLHNAGVIYRDLKPENILLDQDGHVNLIDFGLSKWLSYGSRTGTICGTPQYIAPEVRSSATYGHAVDWWSLGIVACLMMTAEYPRPDFDLPDNGCTVIGKNRMRLPQKPDLDVQSRDILSRLLEINPTKRLRSLRSLQTIGFYKGFNFDDVKKKKLKPFDLLKHFYPEGPPENDDFDSIVTHL